MAQRYIVTLPSMVGFTIKRRWAILRSYLLHIQTLFMNQKIKKYESLAQDARRAVLTMIFEAQSSHIGSNFSCIDILAVLFEKMDLKKDKIIFSKGWAAASAYYFLAQKGVIPKEDLSRYCKPNEEHYIGLVEPTVPGIHFAGGSMGYGLPAGVGFALSKKMKDEEGMIYVLMSDGEFAIGTTWESLLLARHHKLDNLVVIIDHNGLQAMGTIDDILKMSIPFPFTAIDGHDFQALDTIFDTTQTTHTETPFIIDAITIKGKGVSFMENNNLYHYKPPSKEEYDLAVNELNHA